MCHSLTLATLRATRRHEHTHTHETLVHARALTHTHTLVDGERTYAGITINTRRTQLAACLRHDHELFTGERENVRKSRRERVRKHEGKAPVA